MPCIAAAACSAPDIELKLKYSLTVFSRNFGVIKVFGHAKSNGDISEKYCQNCFDQIWGHVLRWVNFESFWQGYSILSVAYPGTSVQFSYEELQCFIFFT
jgi:hypothetical protein